MVAGAVVAAGVSGCQSNPAPKALPSKAPASTAAASPVAAAPTMPAAAKGTGPKAAKAFVRHYVDTVNYASATGNVAALRSLSANSCKSCDSVANRIASVYSAGGSIESAGWKVAALSAVPGQGEAVAVDAALKLSPQTVLKKAHGQAHHFRGGELPVTFQVRRGTDGWVVLEWERAA